jgi:membrane protease YdiL (CAAX protease family)
MNQVVTKNKIVFFYGLTFLISWISWLLMYMVYDGKQPDPIVYLFSTLGGIGPLLSLLLLQKISNKEINVKQILSQIKIREAKKKWFLPAIMGIPLIAIFGNLGSYVFGKDDQLRLVVTGPDELGIFVFPVMLVHFIASLVTSPLFEEPGWRGFALGLLQKRFGRAAGSLFVGLLWWVWHQPMNLTFGLQPSVYSILSMVLLSFAIDSLFNLSGKNLFTAMLAHQSSGTTIAFLYQGDENWLQLCLMLLFVAVLRMLERRKVAELDNLPDPAFS